MIYKRRFPPLFFLPARGPGHEPNFSHYTSCTKIRSKICATCLLHFIPKCVILLSEGEGSASPIKRKEVDIMQVVEHIHCPVNGWDCPYYTDKNHPCRCTLADPMKDCDDFASMWDEGDDYIDDDWVVK